MAFLDETAKLLGLDERTATNIYLYVSPQKGLVVEGFRRLIELSPTKIVLLGEEARHVEILGSNLSVKEISHREMCILGQISAINFV